MEISELPKAVLVFVMVGMILAVGLLTLNLFDRASRDTTTVVSTGYNLSKAGSIDFTPTYCITVKDVSNATASYAPVTYNVVFTDADACVIAYDAISGCGPISANYCNVTYTYGADTTGAGSTTTSVVTALTPIATSWMPLIVTVVVLAIILVLVLGSFGVRRE